MPKSKRPKPLYQRGDFRLFPREDRENLEIVWYDADKRRERSASAGTGDVGEAKLALDRLYLADTGQRFCDACGRPFDGEHSPLVATAIKDYLLLSEGKRGYESTAWRLKQVITYMAETGAAATTCNHVDARWIDGFRKWLLAKPVVKGGRERKRALGGVEGCVLQLAAAINATPGQKAQFANEQMKTVAASPTYRASVAVLASMFRFCLHPEGPKVRSEKERLVYIGYRANLLCYLRAAVATWARPEEIFDLGNDRQWIGAASILDLNPPGRRQTRKYRTRIPVARQFAPYLDAMGARYMPVSSIRSSWDNMRIELGLPDEGEAGPKLIRRSMSTLVRKAIGEANWQQGKMMLGHVPHEISDIYAIPDPANLGLVLGATESIIDEIETSCPGAYRSFTAQEPMLRVVKGEKNV